MPVTSCERADDMTSPSTVVLLWSLWAPSREAKEISSNPISHVTAWLKPEKWNIFPFDVREVFACHRELYMTSKALMIKTSCGPPQPLMVQLMSMRGKGRPQSPASRHIAGCLLLVCYFHWFLNTAGRLSRLKWNQWFQRSKVSLTTSSCMSETWKNPSMVSLRHPDSTLLRSDRGLASLIEDTLHIQLVLVSPKAKNHDWQIVSKTHLICNPTRQVNPPSKKLTELSRNIEHFPAQVVSQGKGSELLQNGLSWKGIRLGLIWADSDWTSNINEQVRRFTCSRAFDLTHMT